MKVTGGLSVKFEADDPAFAARLPERVHEEPVTGFFLGEALRAGDAARVLEALSRAGADGRPLDIFFDIRSDGRVVGIEVLR